MQAVEETELSTARTLTYDANGNLSNDGNGKVYGYDAVNRLISITQSSGVTGFAYDGEGRRVQETLNGTLIKQWVWCDGAQPCEERDASNNVTKRFYAHGEQIGGANYYFTFDHLTSVKELTNSAGSLVARYDYDPYGRRTLVSGTDMADFGFTGFYYHQASGLNLTWFRAYDANFGRWLTRDPLGQIGGVNLYQYVADNPTNRIDPLGLIDLPPIPPEPFFPLIPPGVIRTCFGTHLEACIANCGGKSNILACWQSPTVGIPWGDKITLYSISWCRCKKKKCP
jgi:RHS repeat-associated protein